MNPRSLDSSIFFRQYLHINFSLMAVFDHRAFTSHLQYFKYI